MHKLNSNNTKIRIVALLIVWFILMATASKYLLDRFTDNFELMTSSMSFEGEVDRYFINTGYVYVWSGDDKVLIPPAATNDGTYLSQRIEKGSEISKASDVSQFYLKVKSEILIFTLIEL